MLRIKFEHWRNFGVVLYWFFAFGAKIYRCLPGKSSIVFLAAIVSQIFFTISFFLPLKVILLLGSAELPGYLPASLGSLGRDNLVAGFSVSAVLFYFAHIGLERIIHSLSVQSATQLSNLSERFHFVDGQEGLLRGWYERYFRAISGLFFSALISVFFICFFPLVFLAYSLLLLFLSLALGKSLSSRQAISGKYFNASGSVFFLLGFLCIVGEFWWSGFDGKVYLALIGIILLRQLSVRVTGLYSELNSFYRSHVQLDKMLYNGANVFQSQPNSSGPYEFILDSKKKNLLLERLAQTINLPLHDVDINYLQSSVRGQFSFFVIVTDPFEVKYNFLLKMYAANHDAFARAEQLFMDLGVPLLSPRPLGKFTLGNYQAIIFSLPNSTVPSVLPDMRSVIQQVRLDLMKVEPDKTIERRFVRGHRPLWTRLQDGLYESVLNIAPMLSFYTVELTYFSNRLADWALLLERYPRSYINFEIKTHSVLFAEHGAGYCFQWGRWSIDALGCGWPTNLKDLAFLEKNIGQLYMSRGDIAGLSAAHLKLAALLFDFELLWRRNRFIDACLLLGVIKDTDQLIHGA